MKQAIISIKNNPITFYTLATGIFVAFGLYIYCINTTVRFALIKKNTEEKIASLQDRASDLEYQYIAKSNSITLDSAKFLGLREPANKIFISKSASSKQLSLNK